MNAKQLVFLLFRYLHVMTTKWQKRLSKTDINVGQINCSFMNDLNSNDLDNLGKLGSPHMGFPSSLHTRISIIKLRNVKPFMVLIVN